jgi:outer membrane receptor protein involved in Fe transport
MLDLGSSYTIDKTYSVYFNAKNLTNYRLGFYEGFVNRPIQMELYGPTFQAGININLR